MILKILQAAALCLVVQTPLAAQIITAPESRQQLLDGLQMTLKPEPRDPAIYKAIPSPFDPVKVKKVQPVEREKVPGPVQTVAADIPPRRLPDDEALRAISESFKPIGTLVRGDRGLLRMSGGAMLSAGTTFRAEINGLSYDVLVKEVTSQGYTLSLGTATLNRNFYSTGGTNP